LVTSFWMMTCQSWALAQGFSESPGSLNGVFFGTGIFSLFIIATALFGLALDRLSPWGFVLIMAASLVWMLLIEPILKIRTGTPFGVLEWIADAVTGGVLLTPVIVHQVRRRLSNTSLHGSTESRASASSSAP